VRSRPPFPAARPPAAWIAGLLVLALVAGSCGGEKATDDPRTDDNPSGERGLDDAGDPVRGGRIVYGIEAETSGGWCLPEAQLAPSGNLIRTALYDSLTAINEDAQAKPYLARSVVSDETFTEWTIGLREGVTFHDGSELDASVVKNNLDAYLGRYPPRTPDLFPIVFANIDTVTVTDPLTVQVTTKTPWVALPTYLATIGIIGQTQLDDDENCHRNLIGTGPFELAEWTPDQKLLAQRNPDYWQIAPDGQPYPYADAIEFRPIVDAQQRINAIETGEVNVMASQEPDDIHGALAALSEAGIVNLLVVDDHAEVGYLMLNSGKPPFDDERMRRAVAQGIDREGFNDLTNGESSIVADQPFPEGDLGYVDDPGFPGYDPEAAKALVEQYVADGNDPSLTISAASEPKLLARAEVLQNQLRKIGLEVNIHSVDEATLINEAIGGTFQANLWSQHAGGEPDAQYIWWHGQPNPTNFARIEDPEIDAALEQGRGEPDPAKRKAIYEGLSRRFAEKVWNVWLNYSEWGIALSPQVHGVLSADLPDDGGPVFTGVAAGHPVHGMWITPD
jgi:peptide/nickel transport system substrate-binding protein